MTKANLANRPTIEQVRATVKLDDARGGLIWLVTGGRAIAGRPAGGIDKSTGYYRVRIERMLILLHHVVWALERGEWPTQIDHIDGDKSNNRIGNLRPSTQSQNMANRGKQSDNTSGYKGVFWHKVSGRWAAQIGKNGDTIWLGLFDTPEEASNAYEKAAMEMFGEFYRPK